MSWSECPHFYMNESMNDEVTSSKVNNVSKNVTNLNESKNLNEYDDIENIIDKINNCYKIQDIFYICN
jgi:hypothetical protein